MHHEARKPYFCRIGRVCCTSTLIYSLINIFAYDRSSGLGLATVRDLIAHNAHVAVLDLVPPPPGDFPDDRVRFFKTDIAKTEDVASAVKGCVAWSQETGAVLGGVVNAAGIGTIGKVRRTSMQGYVSNMAQVIDASGEPLSLDLYKYTLEVNVVGTFDLTRLVCQHLVRVPPEGEDGERGVVVMVSSAAAVSQRMMSVMAH